MRRRLMGFPGFNWTHVYFVDERVFSFQKMRGWLLYYLKPPPQWQVVLLVGPITLKGLWILLVYLFFVFKTLPHMLIYAMSRLHSVWLPTSLICKWAEPWSRWCPLSVKIAVSRSTKTRVLPLLSRIRGTMAARNAYDAIFLYVDPFDILWLWERLILLLTLVNAN